jgi:hypothetical protein
MGVQHDCSCCWATCVLLLLLLLAAAPQPLQRGHGVWARHAWPPVTAAGALRCCHHLQLLQMMAPAGVGGGPQAPLAAAAAVASLSWHLGYVLGQWDIERTHERVCTFLFGPLPRAYCSCTTYWHRTAWLTGSDLLQVLQTQPKGDVTTVRLVAVQGCCSSEQQLGKRGGTAAAHPPHPWLQLCLRAQPTVHYVLTRYGLLAAAQALHQRGKDP